MSLTWTWQKPKVSGWYWWRQAITADMGVRYVDVREPIPLGLEWAGPIPEPGEGT